MSDGVERQNPDGTWSPAEPLPFAPGIDIELERFGRSSRWTAYRGADIVGSGRIRTRLGLVLARRSWRRLGFRVFG